MIVTKIQGGLANQIFQWAYARSLQIDYGVEMFLDISYYFRDNGTDTKRSFSLNKFPNLEVNLYQQNMRSNFIDIVDNSAFVVNKIDINHNYYLSGFWQSEKFFNKNNLDIIKSLVCTESKKQEILNLYPLIDTNSVSLHIRRTDYLKSNGYHPVQPISYYEEALSLIQDYDNILVFSDDIEWCKNNLEFKKMTFVETNDEIFDLWAMSLCKNNIIANSSFSWWGAYLNMNSNKKVIAPTNWFGGASVRTISDIIPNSWIKI